MSTIDLKKAIAVEDDEETRANLLTPASGSSTNRTYNYGDDFEGPCGVERSFRLVFAHDQEIAFYADTNQDKNRWCEFHPFIPFMLGLTLITGWTSYEPS